MKAMEIITIIAPYQTLLWQTKSSIFNAERQNATFEAFEDAKGLQPFGVLCTITFHFSFP